ncbi:DUF885 domain-containing protein [Chloroflexota bacterium]|nr:DUF885 domain-containing protein [Chloroflexota bacterium]
MPDKRLMTHILLLLILIVGLLSGCQQPPDLSPAESVTLEDLLDGLETLSPKDFMEEAYKRLVLRSPQTVTEVGLAGFFDARNAALDSYDLQDLLLTQAFEVELLALARDIDQTKLDEAVQLDLQTFTWYLEDRVALHPYQWRPFPLWNELGSLTDQLVYMLMVQQPFTDESDIEDYLARLEAIGPQVDQIVTYLYEQQAAGVQIPYVLYSEVMEEMGAHRWQVGRKTPFVSVLAVRLYNLEGLSQEDYQTYYGRGGEIADRVILPAFDRLMDALYDLAGSTTEQVGLPYQPDGALYYSLLLHQITTLERSPEEWLELGEGGLAELEVGVRRLAAEAGYDPDETLQEIFRQAKVDQDYALGLDIFVALHNLLIDAEMAMSGAFESEIEKDLVMVPVYQGAFFEPAALDGSRRAAFYAGFTGQDALFDMPTRIYRETFPGRYFQTAVVNELDLPLFRKALHFPAYDQGWTLYAEHLAWEMGMYEDEPNTNLARLQQEMIGTAQVVVDVGLHSLGWDMPTAARYLVEHAGMDRSEANDLVLVQIAQPGQALAVYAGYALIRDLRTQAEAALGANFDLKAFHAAVLNGGSLPLPLLEEQVRKELGY